MYGLESLMKGSITINVKKLNDKCMLPTVGSKHAAGYDLYACLEEEVKIEPGRRFMVPCGFCMEMVNPSGGVEAQVRPRSGLAFKHGVTVLNAPGTIDSDYRGEVKVVLINLGDVPFVVRHGMRIAQMVVKEVPWSQIVQVDELSDTDRGTGGFGSTGE